MQDLGDFHETVRTTDQIRRSGVDVLMPDETGDHGEAMHGIREVLEQHYGEHLDELAEEGKVVIINRAVFPSDDVPRIEYTVVDEMERDDE
jgi:hypothetical protein